MPRGTAGMPLLTPILIAENGIQVWARTVVAVFAPLIWWPLIALIAISSFWIHGYRMIGPFSPIHLLSIFTLAMLPLAVVHARHPENRSPLFRIMP